MGEVVEFPSGKVLTPDESTKEADNILENCKGTCGTVLVLGWPPTEDGNMIFAGNMTETGDVLLAMDLFRHRLMLQAFNDDTHDGPDAA